jgi:hypothetical protein
MIPGDCFGVLCPFVTFIVDSGVDFGLPGQFDHGDFRWTAVS